MTDTPAQRLLDLTFVPGDRPTRLSVIGLSKNAGKTVALNHLIRAAAQREIPLGLVSTGRDGEEQDAITELPKPRIWVPTGAWVATAEAALGAGTGGVTPLRELPMATPFGKMVLGQVERAGEVLLIGPGTTRRIAEVLDGLEEYGAQFCLVDGSFDRIAAAAPVVTGRVVLAAGAAYSANMAESIAQVRHVLDLFDLPPLSTRLGKAAVRAMTTAPVSVVTLGGEIIPVPVVSGLADPEQIVSAAIAYPHAHLVLAGALSDRLLGALIERRAHQVTLVIKDPTHILVDRMKWSRWRRLGGMAYVSQSVQLVAITTNPHSPVGADYDAQIFQQAVAEVAKRPVFDLESEVTA